jgi:hemolysin activation/secretion protein
MQTKTSLKSVKLAALACGAIGNGTLALGQGLPAGSVARDVQVPSSGSILQSNPVLNPPADPHASDAPQIESERPAAQVSGPDEESVHVSRIEVDDAPAYLKSKIDALVAAYRDREMTLPDLRNVAVEITQVLLDHGESISYAYVPEQDFTGSVVRLRIMRGHVESVVLQNNRSLVRNHVLRALLERGLASSGDVKVMQEQLARVSDLPGVGKVTPILSPGETLGGTVLSVNAEAGQRVEGAIVADNAGSRTTGRNRIGMQIGINSPLGLGDRLQAIAYAAPQFFQGNHESDGGRTLIGRVSYDLPVGLTGARAGMAVTGVDYTLGGELRDLGDGFATVYGVYGSYPLMRAKSHEIGVNANLDYKRLSDNLAEPNRRTARALTLQLAGTRQGQFAGLPNVLQYSAGVTGGMLSNADNLNAAKTRGKYVKTTESVKLAQGLYKGVYLQLSVDAQQSSRNLDGSEKMGLGGPNAVRAYSNDTASVDSGYIASASLNVAVPKVAGLTVQVFYDRAQGSLQKFARGNRDVTVAGYGVGMNFTNGKRAAVNLSYAMRAGNDRSLGQQHRATMWASTVVRF